MRAQVQAWYGSWLRRRIPAARSVTLDQRRVFIFPTRYGFFYLTICVLLFLGGINYENNLIMGFSFMLTSLFITSIMSTFRNLAGVTLVAGQYRAGFAGAHGAVEVRLVGGRRYHRSLWLRWRDSKQQAPREVSLEPQAEDSVWLDVLLPRRGWVDPGRLQITTRYPLGLLRAWSYVDLDHACLAWPTPVASQSAPASGGEEEQGERQHDHGSEDFEGVREYQPGDSLRAVDWKKLARGQGMNTKMFNDPVEGRLWLEWDRLQGLDPEARLQRLCWWVEHLNGANQPYGIALPGESLSPATGSLHHKQALDMLALYGQPRREVN